MFEDPTALNGADPAADPAASIADPAPATDPAPGSEIPAVTDPAPVPAVDPVEDPPAPQMVPLDRLNEVIEERNSLRETSAAMSRNIETLTALVTKSQSAPLTPKETEKTQDALDQLIASGEITKEDAIKLQKVVDALGYARKSNEEDPRIKALESTVKTLQQREAEKLDAAELAETLKKFEGVISEQQLTDKMVEFAKSKDPKLVRLAREGSYEEIAREGFFTEIVQAEVAKATAGKPAPAPKIDPAPQKPVKQPQEKELLFDPANPKAYERELRQRVLAKAKQQAE